LRHLDCFNFGVRVYSRISGSSSRGNGDNFIGADGENAVSFFSTDIAHSGETSEGGKDGVIARKPEAGGAEAGDEAFAQNDCGVDVPGDDVACWVFDGMVGEAKRAAEMVEAGVNNIKGGVKRRAADVVISLDGNDFELWMAVAPFQEGVEHHGTHSLGRVKEVAEEEERARICVFDNVGEPFEIGGCGLRRGDSGGAERGGFSEVEIGDDEDFFSGPKEGFFREEMELFALAIDDDAVHGRRSDAAAVSN
jgi:hypothetical protein